MYKKIIILSIYLFLMYSFISCSNRGAKSSNSVILYKQVSISDDADLSFEKKYFWEDNKKNNSFITQNFSILNYTDIINLVQKLELVGNESPEYSNHIIYSFVLHKNNKKLNDTIYYDGYSKWWIISNKKQSQYEDRTGKLSDRLKKNYPIFRNCSYP